LSSAKCHNGTSMTPIAADPYKSEDPHCPKSMNRDDEIVVAPILSHIIIKQEPSTEEAEASIPTENVRDDPEDPDDPDLDVTVVVCRKAAKRTFPWDLAVGELNLVSPPPQPEEIDSSGEEAKT
jgi:hypothetical protein